ncbi:MAG: hypothetical protein H6845_00540 [Alphaproteobacteria bacterium]|nr:MAG: hypothetical protein H6845_00540 [Alphaproteobacteria bacterium]
MNQILRNIKNNIAEVRDDTVKIKVVTFFILTLLTVACTAFMGGFFIKDYLTAEQTISIKTKQTEMPNIKQQIMYEINLGTFVDVEIANEFANKFRFLDNVIEKSGSTYVVKMKGKFDLLEANNIAKNVRDQYKIITTLVESKRS